MFELIPLMLERVKITLTALQLHALVDRVNCPPYMFPGNPNFNFELRVKGLGVSTCLLSQ